MSRAPSTAAARRPFVLPASARLPGVAPVGAAIAAIAAVVAAALVVPIDRAARTVGPDDAAASPVRPALAAHADCLWYSARNHGFYLVQREAALAPGPSGDGARATWGAFLGTVGARDCGAVPGGAVEDLLDALAAGADEADRHFLGAGA